MADTEQHFILRVQDAELAARLRGWLRGSERDSDKLEELRLLFDDGEGPTCSADVCTGRPVCVPIQSAQHALQQQSTANCRRCCHEATQAAAAASLEHNLGSKPPGCSGRSVDCHTSCNNLGQSLVNTRHQPPTS